MHIFHQNARDITFKNKMIYRNFFLLQTTLLAL